MQRVFVTSIQVALMAAALSACNESAPTVAVTSVAKVAEDDRVLALNKLKAATDAKQGGVAGDMVTELAEDQAAFEGLIGKLKGRLTKRVAAGDRAREPDTKEKR
jgi:hypothetical protein